MEQPTAFGLLLSDDLLDGSRVTGAARAVGLEVRQLRTPDALLTAASERRPACVLIDLHNPGLVVEVLARQITSLAPRPRLIGYGSHVDAARLRAARQAGCDMVMPRSQFFNELEPHIGEWLAVTPTDKPGV